MANGYGVSNKRVDLAYNDAGQYTTITRYESTTTSNLVATSTYGYDTGGRLTDLDHDKGATSLASYDWTYDASNRITQLDSDDGITDYTYLCKGQAGSSFDFPRCAICWPYALGG